MKKIGFLSILLMSCLSCQTPATKTKTQSDYFEIARTHVTGDLAYSTTAYVEQFWRIAGNTGFNKSIDGVVEQLEDAGYVDEAKATETDRLTYRIEKRPMDRPTWEPIDASLSIVGDSEPLLQFSTNRNMIYINSFSTPKEGVTAEVIHIKSLDELESADVSGKIVFAEISAYRLFQPAIVDGGAIGLITYSNPDYLQPEKNVTSIQFRSMMYSESQQTWGIALSYQAKERLMEQLNKGKTEVNVNIATNIYPSEELTVIANIKGSELPDESLVLSAHVQEPGANDNASGVGAQLELATVAAQLLKDKTIEAKRTLTFIWGDEIISTRRYVQDSTSNNPKIKWGISLDMVGENTSITGGSFLIEKMPDPSAIWTRGNDKHSEWGGSPLELKDMFPHYLNDFIISVFKAQGQYANWEVNTNPYEGGSDHVPFLRGDIPGLLLWHFTDQFYHTDNDRIDKVSKETLKNVATATLVSVLTLINADETTALKLIDLINTEAKKRLNAELQLSKNAIADGASVDDELHILNAWTDWYDTALATIGDILPESALEADNKINLAQQELEEFAESLVSPLY